MILNGVVSAAFKHLSNLGPLVAVVAVHQVEDPLLLATPPDFLDLGIQMIVPPLTTLLSNAPWEVLRNQSPLLGPVLVDQVKHHAVFFFGPRALDETGVEHLLPSVKALDICAPGQVFGYPLPVLSTVLSDSVC